MNVAKPENQKPHPIVFHVWNDYTSSLFDQSHPYFLKKNNIHSQLLVAKLLKNNAKVYPETSVFSHRSVDNLLDPSFISRVNSRFFSSLFWLRFQNFCKKKIRGEITLHRSSPALIHAHFGTTGAMITPLIKDKSLPSVVSFYGVDVSMVLRHEKWLKRYKKMFQTYTSFIVLCEEAKMRLINHGCRADRIHILNLPAGIESYPYLARTPNQDPNAPIRFISGARFVEKKGLDTLIKAFTQVLASGKKAKLTLIGYGPLKEKLEQLARDLGVTEHIQFIDTRLNANFKDVYSAALREHDIFVLPSTVGSDGDDEGGPALSLVCAQAAGLPVISSQSPWIGISVVDHQTGRLCEANNPQSLAQVMLDLINDPAQWNVLGLAGSKKVAEEFGLETQMEKLFKIYNQAIDAHATQN